MHIALITDAWSPQVNGVVTTLKKTVEQLRNWGHTVYTINPNLFRTVPCPTYPDIRLSLFPPKKIAGILNQFVPQAIHIATEGTLGWAARSYCIRNNLDFTTSYHTRFPEYIRMRFPLPLFLSYSAIKRFHQSSKRTMAATQDLANELKAKGFANLRLWSRGVDTDLFRPRSKEFLTEKRPIMLYVGRMAIEKNIKDFLNLSLPGTKYVIGDGPARKELQNRYPDVLFPGFKTGVELAQYIAAADIFVFPSRTDTFGLVMLEALACGVPVAAYPVTGPKQLIKNGSNGYLHEDLETAVTNALHVSPKKCREFATEYSWEKCSTQFLNNLFVMGGRMSPRKKKLYVLDTNVILHDSSCANHFEEHDIAIPITVLEELDQFKKGNEAVNFHARQFTRLLDDLSDGQLFNGGVSISPGLGKISIKLEQDFDPDIARSFPENKPDHRILNVAYILSKVDQKHHIILVSKDVNLRMKAISVGLLAQDYKNDHVKDLGDLYKGHRCIEGIPDSLIDQLFRNGNTIQMEELGKKIDIHPNEFLVLRNGKHSALAFYNATNGTIQRIERETCYGITPRNAEQSFALAALLNPEIELITITGKAGSGKTLLALAAALHIRKQYRQIFIARPVVPLSNKDIGFLPGDIQSKLDPYMQPLFDNLTVLQMKENNGRAKCIHEMLDEAKLVITPLAYIRGRSLVKTFFIVDEAQNLTPHEIKTIITRAGEGTKIIFTGDIFQIDHPYLNSHSNGLSYLIAKMQGQPLYAHINLEKGERSRLADLASTLL